jgi:hypothetical protein
MEIISPVLVALIGSAGAVGILQTIQMLSTRRRLHAAIRSNSALLANLEDGDAAASLRQAITTDSLKLASLSLFRPAPALGGWPVPVFYLFGFISASALVALVIGGWKIQVFIDLMPLIVMVTFVILFSPYLLLVTMSSRRRQQYVQAALTLAESSPKIVTADVRAGRRALAQRRQRAINRNRRRQNATLEQWTSLRLHAIRRRRRRRSVWYTIFSI